MFCFWLLLQIAYDILLFRQEPRAYRPTHQCYKYHHIIDDTGTMAVRLRMAARDTSRCLLTR